ncbi:hypothetical protein TNCV_4400621 [Trichonephila clavipes]|nr:hypothetical protein TNCV_4400621 [Trichonephila clavipes]
MFFFSVPGDFLPASQPHRDRSGSCRYRNARAGLFGRRVSSEFASLTPRPRKEAVDAQAKTGRKMTSCADQRGEVLLVRGQWPEFLQVHPGNDRTEFVVCNFVEKPKTQCLNDLFVNFASFSHHPELVPDIGA